MIGLALNIIAFIFVVSFFIFLILGALALIGTIFESSSSKDNKSKGLLIPVLRKLGINEGETIRSDTSEELLKEAIDIYYEILKKVFESETPEQKKEILISNTPSGKISNAFFALSGLSKSINILIKDINYVIDGSGWTEQKNLLKTATGGTLKKIGDGKYEIVFDKKFYLTIEEYSSGYDYSYDSEKEWRIEGYYNKKEVLSCYAPRTNDTAYIFKPDIWILNILRSAKKYSILINELELNNATERRKKALFV